MASIYSIICLCHVKKRQKNKWKQAITIVNKKIPVFKNSLCDPKKIFVHENIFLVNESARIMFFYS